jgi:hypothetical protein
VLAVRKKEIFTRDDPSVIVEGERLGQKKKKAPKNAG